MAKQLLFWVHMNELRNQTQFRVDEGFVGQDTSKRALPEIELVLRELSKYGSHQFTKGEGFFKNCS